MAKAYPYLHKVMGQELVGLKLKAPLTKYEYVYALPMTTISVITYLLTTLDDKRHRHCNQCALGLS